MSVEALRLVARIHGITGPTKAVLWVLANCANNQGKKGGPHITYMGMREIAKQAGCTTRTVINATARLQKMGLITIHRRAKPTPAGAVNVYEINLKWDPDSEQLVPAPSAATDKEVAEPLSQTAEEVCEPLSEVCESGSEVCESRSTEPIEPIGTHSSIARSARSSISQNAAAAAEVEEIYQAYPIKKGKRNALKAIRKSIKEGADPAEILEGVKAFTRAYRRGAPAPHASTYFNQERWADEDNGKVPDLKGNNRRGQVDRALPTNNHRPPKTLDLS